MHPASQIQREKIKNQRFSTQSYQTPHQDAPQTDTLRIEILSVRLRRSTMTPRPFELDVCTGPRTGMRTEIAGGRVKEFGSWMGKALWDPLRCYRVTALSKGTLSATLPICTSGFEPHRCANGIEILRCGGKLVSSTPAAARPQKPSAADVGTYNGVRCRSGVMSGANKNCISINFGHVRARTPCPPREAPPDLKLKKLKRGPAGRKASLVPSEACRVWPGRRGAAHRPRFSCTTSICPNS